MKTDLPYLLDKASKSPMRLWFLNQILSFQIPFNRPHGFGICKIEEDMLTVKIPFKRKNLNHINGIHACAIATAGEFVSGLSILRFISPKEYRIILKSIHVDYFYQAKTISTSRIQMDKVFAMEHIIQPLQSQDAVFVELTSEIFDAQQNKLSDCKTVWQIKPWNKIKTKV